MISRDWLPDVLGKGGCVEFKGNEKLWRNVRRGSGRQRKSSWTGTGKSDVERKQFSAWVRRDRPASEWRSMNGAGTPQWRYYERLRHAYYAAVMSASVCYHLTQKHWLDSTDAAAAADTISYDSCPEIIGTSGAFWPVGTIDPSTSRESEIFPRLTYTPRPLPSRGTLSDLALAVFRVNWTRRWKSLVVLFRNLVDSTGICKKKINKTIRNLVRITR